MLLHEFNVPNASFSADVLGCLPPDGWAITEDLIGEERRRGGRGGEGRRVTKGERDRKGSEGRIIWCRTLSRKPHMPVLISPFSLHLSLFFYSLLYQHHYSIHHSSSACYTFSMIFLSPIHHTAYVLSAQRTDLRHIPVVSIDPPGCKDIDDALHCIR